MIKLNDKSKRARNLGKQTNMSNKLWPKRIYSLDVTRGFAALAVVVWHWQHFSKIRDTFPQNFDRASQPFYPVLKIFYEKGFMGVEYFFILSGFIFFWLYRDSIKNKTTSFSFFWMQRISRLYPLHIATLIIVALLQAVFTAKNGSSFIYPFNDIHHFFLQLGFASRWGLEKGWSFNAPIWSVSIEILLYFVFFFVALFTRGKALSCLAVSVISFIILQFINHPFFMGLSLFFLGGFIFYISFNITIKSPRWKSVVYFIATLAWLLIIANFYFIDLSQFILKIGFIGEIFLHSFSSYILFPFTVCAMVLLEIDKGSFLKTISWIGDITYSSYLLHFPLQLLFALAVSYGMLTQDFYLNPIYIIIFYSILIPLSYITFIGFERPVQSMIRRNYFLHKKSKQNRALDSSSSSLDYSH
ncbi:MAG: acyltransferase [Calditrichaeota bacterium]|nr:MAG: acyltransferase [Calditrichota bacterium]